MRTLEFAFKLEDKPFEFLEFKTALLDLDFERDVLFKCSVDLIGGELSESFFEKVDSQLDVEIFLFEGVDVLYTLKKRTSWMQQSDRHHEYQSIGN